MINVLPWHWHPVMTFDGFCYVVMLLFCYIYIYIVFCYIEVNVTLTRIYIKWDAWGRKHHFWQPVLITKCQQTHFCSFLIFFSIHNFSWISLLQVKLWYNMFSRITFTWDSKWTQTSVKSQTALKSCSVYMAILLIYMFTLFTRQFRQFWDLKPLSKIVSLTLRF